ncbi:cation-translocating P-type ATPase [Halomonas sp. DP8Y7-1]|uniref:heavy metal translocating P-type ATPase n=1 Tax=Halomonas sp. DP8Y7-1 TaxID=2859078 RepID=UPI001C970334|nr:cation-translocating P-type ATPase [Halomonas sp. DP8Y7-1]MBY6029048.1 cation-translocating P-type ATPase [Halomonas sp. DP8Y7-1]
MADLERQTPSDDPSSCCSVGHTKASCGNDPSGTSSAHCSSTQSASTQSASTENAPTDSTSAATPEGTQRLDVIVDEMCCPTEERVLRKALNSLPGVEQLTFDTMQRRLTIHHRNVDRRAVASRIQEAGMTARFLDQAKQEPPRDSASLPWARLAVAGALALGAEVTGWLGLGVPWLAALLAIIAIAMVGLPTWKKGLLALRQGTLNINALMSVAVTGAMLIGHWSEAAMVIVLFTLAEHLEARSLERARRAISGLLDLAPPMARVRDESAAEANRWREIKAEEVRPGTLVRVFAGERLALDGEIVRGEASLDEAPITGESLPRERGPGDTVYAGSINLSGDLDYRVTRDASDTTLARIIHAVEDAQSRRAPTQRTIDRFAAVYTPVVFVLALVVAVGWPLLGLGPWLDGVYRALVLLVIACPCALVISTPVTVVSGLGAAARQGILIKGGAFLEQATRLTHLAMDKTGTLTEGKPHLVSARAIGDTSDKDCHRLAVALAERSNHPVSRALVVGLGAQPDVTLEQVEERSGRGLVAREATSDTDMTARVWLGNDRLARDMGVDDTVLLSHGPTDDAAGVVWLGRDATVLGSFKVRDALRPSSKAAIKRLHRQGVKVSVLSGDSQSRVDAIALEAGIDEAFGELLPEDKLEHLDALAKRGTTGMVGDGINDAPALARADVGIAMGAAGSDVAIETADIALMNDDPASLPRLIDLARTTRRLLVQNIALALGIKAVFLVLALTGNATLWMAVFADLGSSLLVVGNGLRILKARFTP